MKCNNRANEKNAAKGLGSKIDYSRQGHIPKSALRAGDVSRCTPIHPDSRTTVYCKPGSNLKERETFWYGLINRYSYE